MLNMVRSYRVYLKKTQYNAVADPGFTVGGTPTCWGCQPPTQVLFGENVCENERIGSRGSVRRACSLDPPVQ